MCGVSTVVKREYKRKARRIYALKVNMPGFEPVQIQIHGESRHVAAESVCQKADS